MGLLDKIRSAGKSDKLPPGLAVMVVLTTCIQYDGEVGDEEIHKLRSILAWSPLFASNTQEEDDRLIGQADEIVEKLGINGAMDLAVQSLPNHLRTTALCFAYDLVFSDGSVDDSEKEFLSVTARKMGIPAEILDAIDLVTHSKYACA
jgi:uncharacterized tellurite resistance protein B-like protein